MATETQNIEWKQSWRDEYLEWVAGFANAQGGKIYIGKTDTNKVVGVDNPKKLMEDIPNKIVNNLGLVCDVNLLEENDLPYIEIVVNPSNFPILYQGVAHYRSGATKQILRGTALQDFIIKKMNITWDAAICENARIEDIDSEAVKFLVNAGIRNSRLPVSAASDSIETTMKNLKLMTDEGKITNAAVLLLGKDPDKFFPLCQFRIGRFLSNKVDVLFHDIIDKDIIRMGDRVVEILKAKYLISPIHYEGMMRMEPLEFPEDALREIIYNAIIHKRYPGAHIQMRVYDDAVTIWNEGTLPAGYTMEDIIANDTSLPRNKLIAQAFYMAGFIENWGRGIKKVFEAFSAAGFEVPVFEEKNGGVMVTIKRKPIDGLSPEAKEKSKENVTENVTEQITDRQSLILDILRKGVIENVIETSASIAQKTRVSQRTVMRDLNALRAKGLVQHVGPDKGGYWEVLK